MYDPLEMIPIVTGLTCLSDPFSFSLIFLLKSFCLVKKVVVFKGRVGSTTNWLDLIKSGCNRLDRVVL